MDYERLLKLLYIADRECLRETGRPITYAQGFAFPLGPIHSEIYDLVKGSRADAELWSRFINTHGYKVKRIEDPGRGRLSRHEIEKLREVSEKFERFTSEALRDITHSFEEYSNHKPEGNTPNPIPLADIIDAVGRSDIKEDILADLREKQALDEFLSAAIENDPGKLAALDEVLRDGLE